MVLKEMFSFGQKKVIELDPYQDLKERVQDANSYVMNKIGDPKAEMFQLQLGIVPKERIQRFFYDVGSNLERHRESVKAELLRHNPMTFPIDKREVIKALGDLREMCKHLEENPQHFRVRTTELQHKAQNYMKAADVYRNLSTRR